MGFVSLSPYYETTNRDALAGSPVRVRPWRNPRRAARLVTELSKGRDADASHGRDHRDSEARGHLDPVLVSDDADHRGGGGGRDAAGDLPPGAGRRPYGRWL